MKIVLFLTFILISTLNFAQIRLSEKQIIFGKNEKIYLDINPYKNLERFTPNIGEIKIAEEILENTLTTKDLKLGNYYRQYAGFLKDGAKILFINTSCKNVEYFEKNTFYPKGGGKCYFRSFVNIKTNKMEKFIESAPK